MTHKDFNNPLETEKISKLLFKFAIPSIIGMLVNSLYNILDQVFIGWRVGMLGNAATNVAFPITTICLATALLFGIGGASSFNIAQGKKETEKSGYLIGNTITSLAISSIVLFIVLRIFLNSFMTAFGATEQTLDMASRYAKITSYGIPFLIVSTGMSFLIRADGSPSYSMMCMLIGAVINTVLDFTFIYVFQWGLEGAAWGL